MTAIHPISSLGSLEHDLVFWKDEPFRHYRPQFAVEPQGNDILWLTDHGRRIALVHKPHDQIDLFEFRPGSLRLKQPELPAVYHAPTMLGATAPEEGFILYRTAHRILKDRGIRVQRALVGEFATSMEMAGASLSLMRLDEEMLRLLRVPSHSPLLLPQLGRSA